MHHKFSFYQKIHVGFVSPELIHVGFVSPELVKVSDMILAENNYEKLA